MLPPVAVDVAVVEGPHLLPGSDHRHWLREHPGVGQLVAVGLPGADRRRVETDRDGLCRTLADRLTVIEERISDQRRTLHERIDKLQAEIVSRYKTGEATVDGLLVPRPPDSGNG